MLPDYDPVHSNDSRSPCYEPPELCDYCGEPVQVHTAHDEFGPYAEIICINSHCPQKKEHQ